MTANDVVTNLLILLKLMGHFPCQSSHSLLSPVCCFNNALLLQAAYIINGNCKNVMNMSQSDQEDLWTSVMNGTSVPC